MAKAVINLQKESGGTTKISSADGTGVTELVVPESGNLVSVGTAVTDNAVARYDGTTGKLQNSGVIIDDNGNVGIGTSSPVVNLGKSLHIYNNINTGTANSNATLKLESANRNSAIILQGITNTISMSTSAGVSAGGISMDSTIGTTLFFGSKGFGYGAGAGGTVTQLTSKSTAVTLNKPCGRIIMNNASLAAGAIALFQVNNNLVITTDNISVIAIDNANYEVTLGWNTTGGFTIRVKNITAGALSESLNIQFLVCKGVVG